MIKRVEHFFDRLAQRIDDYQKGADDKVLKAIDDALCWSAWAMVVVTAAVVLAGVRTEWWFL